MLLSGLFQQIRDQGSFEAFLKNPSSFCRMFNLSVGVSSYEPHSADFHSCAVQTSKNCLGEWDEP